MSFSTVIPDASVGCGVWGAGRGAWGWAGVVVAQLRTIMEDLNLRGELLEQVVGQIGADDDALLKIMKAFEFGVNEQDQRSPWTAMLMSGGLFMAGSLTSVVPFFVSSDVTEATIAAAALSGAGMLVVGGLKVTAASAQRTTSCWCFCLYLGSSPLRSAQPCQLMC